MTLKFDEKFKLGQNETLETSFKKVKELRLMNAKHLDKLNLESSFPNLNSLNLSRCAISQVLDAFPKSATSFILNDNDITSVDVRDLFNYPRLETLFLEGNKLVKFTSHLSSLYRLETLSLRRNVLRNLDQNAFQETPNLKALNLAFNLLSKVSASTLKPLDRLQRLDLSNNRLISVDADAFSSLKNLKWLSLKSNQLTSLPVSLPLLDWFDFSSNQLSSLSEQHKLSLSVIEFVIIGDNPYVCDCDLVWLKEFYDRRRYQLNFERLDGFEARCAAPSVLAGISWAALDDEHFECDGSVTKTEASRTKPAFDPQEMTVQRGQHEATSLAVLWSFSGRVPCPTVVIQYYVFGQRKSTLKLAEVSVLQHSFTIKGLEPQSNYVVCVVPNLHRDKKVASLSPLSMQHCIEVATKEVRLAMPNTYFNIFCYYVIAITSVVIFLMIMIGVCALVAGACASREEPWSTQAAHEMKSRDGSKTSEGKSSSESDEGITFSAERKEHCD